MGPRKPPPLSRQGCACRVLTRPPQLKVCVPALRGATLPLLTRACPDPDLGLNPAPNPCPNGPLPRPPRAPGPVWEGVLPGTESPHPSPELRGQTSHPLQPPGVHKAACEYSHFDVLMILPGVRRLVVQGLQRERQGEGDTSEPGRAPRSSTTAPGPRLRDGQARTRARGDPGRGPSRERPVTLGARPPWLPCRGIGPRRPERAQHWGPHRAAALVRGPQTTARGPQTTAPAARQRTRAQRCQEPGRARGGQADARPHIRCTRSRGHGDDACWGARRVRPPAPPLLRVPGDVRLRVPRGDDAGASVR